MLWRYSKNKSTHVSIVYKYNYFYIIIIQQQKIRIYIYEILHNLTTIIDYEFKDTICFR